MKQIPIWEKSNLTLEEAAAYSGIGINKLRQLTDDDNCEFVLWIGTKRLIKRRKFDEYIEKLEQVGNIEVKFDLVKLYESILLCNNMQKQELEAIYERINEDGIYVTELIGNNGPISDEELQKIHKANLDKMRKLV